MAHYKKLLVMATAAEARPFIDGLGLAPARKAPLRVYDNSEWALVISGIGKTAAAMATTYSLITFSPKVVINLGAAGSVDPALHLGDVRQVSRILELDRPRFRGDGVFSHQPATLTGIPEAYLATQDKPVLTVSDRRHAFQFAQLVDMEAACVVAVSKRFGRPCHVFKFVSDTPEHTTGNDIMAHIREYGNAFFSFFYQKILPLIPADFN